MKNLIKKAMINATLSAVTFSGFSPSKDSDALKRDREEHRIQKEIEAIKKDPLSYGIAFEGSPLDFLSYFRDYYNLINEAYRGVKNEK